MPKILILANSYKTGARCIAGREIIADGQSFKMGEWIRPIDPNGKEGAIALSVSRLNENEQPEIGHVVDVPLREENSGNPLQPENRIIENEKWQLDKNLTEQVKGKWNQLVESPADLWIEVETKTDRVSVQELERRIANGVPHQSLYLISVPLLKIQLRPSPWKPKMTWRASFSVGGRNYNLSITDPSIEQIIGINKLPDQKMERELRNCYLCVSLGGAFHGFHYKLVATIITGK